MLLASLVNRKNNEEPWPFRQKKYLNEETFNFQDIKAYLKFKSIKRVLKKALWNKKYTRSY